VEGLRAIPGVTCEWPGGAFYAFPNVSAHLGEGKHAHAKTCTELSKLLLEKAHVAHGAGRSLGAPGYLRLSSPPPSNASTKVCAVSNVFSHALKPRRKP